MIDGAEVRIPGACRRCYVWKAQQRRREALWRTQDELGTVAASRSDGGGGGGRSQASCRQVSRRHETDAVAAARLQTCKLCQPSAAGRIIRITGFVTFSESQTICRRAMAVYFRGVVARAMVAYKVIIIITPSVGGGC